MLRKRIIASVIFVTLMLGVLYRTDEILKLKGVSDGYPMQMYYEQEEGTIDVLNLGSSHMYTSANPAVMWEAYGMASYSLGGSVQPLWNTYYYLQEALKYQKPKLIVLDAFSTTIAGEYQEASRVVMNTTGMKLTKEKMESVQISREPWTKDADFFLGYPAYHSRYAGLTDADFLPYGGEADEGSYKGFAPNCISTTPVGDFTDVSQITEVREMSGKSYEYLTKTLELAKENEIPVLLIVAPYTGITYEDKKIFNHAEQIAAEYGVPFIDFNEQCREIGLDPANDFAESHHMNYYGSEKFSRYLGKYIMENYDIADRRGDKRYASWETNCAYYRKLAADVDLAKTTDAAEYLEKLFANKERYTICFSLDRDYYRDNCGYLFALDAQGLDVWNERKWVLKNGQLLYHTNQGEDAPFFYEDLGKLAVAVSDGKISMGETTGELVWNGLNILVYDNELEKVVDVAGMDADAPDVVYRGN